MALTPAFMRHVAVESWIRTVIAGKGISLGKNRMF